MLLRREYEASGLDIRQPYNHLTIHRKKQEKLDRMK